MNTKKCSLGAVGLSAELQELARAAAACRAAGLITNRPYTVPKAEYAPPQKVRGVEIDVYRREKYLQRTRPFLRRGLTWKGTVRKNKSREELMRLFGYGTKLYRRAYMRIWRGQAWDDLRALAKL